MWKCSGDSYLNFDWVGVHTEFHLWFVHYPEARMYPQILTAHLSQSDESTHTDWPTLFKLHTVWTTCAHCKISGFFFFQKYSQQNSLNYYFTTISLQSWELKLSVIDVCYYCLRFKFRLNSDGGLQTCGKRVSSVVCVWVSEWVSEKCLRVFANTLTWHTWALKSGLITIDNNGSLFEYRGTRINVSVTQPQILWEHFLHD